jgi:ribosomal protein S18 acetylase RimI-like enzyme
MIRPTLAADTPHLVEIARETGVFKPLEIVALEEVLDDYHAANQLQGHRAVTIEQEGQPIGFAYYAPAAMTDRTWYLYWIAVSRSIQARGIGSRLLHFAEEEIAKLRGRLLLIETSGLPHYEPTRRFYAKHGYHVASRISDYYADGDDMVVFGKRFSPPGPGA